MRLTFILIAVTVAAFVTQNLVPLTTVSLEISLPQAAETGYQLRVNGEVVETGLLSLPAGTTGLDFLISQPEFAVKRALVTFSNPGVQASDLSVVSTVTKTFSLVPAAALDGAWWQFITYLFMHANPIHILFNMFTLFIFGPGVEAAVGRKLFILLYVISGLGSAALHIGLTGVDTTLLLGASGAVFGVLATYGIMFPKNWIFTMFGPMPAMVAIPVFAALEFIFGIAGVEAGVANFGHVGGILTGVAIGLVLRYHARRKPVKLPPGYEFIWK